MKNRRIPRAKTLHTVGLMDAFTIEDVEHLAEVAAEIDQERRALNAHERAERRACRDWSHNNDREAAFVETDLFDAFLD